LGERRKADPSASFGMTISLDNGHETCEITDFSTKLSSRPSRRAVEPERTRISCHAALDMAACVAFRKECRMEFAKVTDLDRKSRVA
jgi:hypothetical protein